MKRLRNRFVLGFILGMFAMCAVLVGACAGVYFSNDFNTFYDCILENLVVFQVLQRFVCDKLFYVVNLFDNMLKPSSVSNYFSHI